MPLIEEGGANKKYVEDELDIDNILRLNQLMGNYLKVSFGSKVCNLMRYDRKQILATTLFENPN